MFYFILENPLKQFLSRANLKNPYTSKTLGRLLKSFALTGIIMIIFGFSAVQLVYNWRTGWRGCLPYTVRGLVIRGSLYWCFTAGFSLFLFIYLFIFFTEFPAYSIILKQLWREIRARSLDTAYLRTKDSPLTGLPKNRQSQSLHFSRGNMWSCIFAPNFRARKRRFLGSSHKSSACRALLKPTCTSHSRSFYT